MGFWSRVPARGFYSCTTRTECTVAQPTRYMTALEMRSRESLRYNSSTAEAKWLLVQSFRESPVAPKFARTLKYTLSRAKQRRGRHTISMCHHANAWAGRFMSMGIVQASLLKRQPTISHLACAAPLTTSQGWHKNAVCRLRSTNNDCAQRLRRLFPAKATTAATTTAAAATKTTASDHVASILIWLVMHLVMHPVRHDEKRTLERGRPSKT